ncbi:MAG: hypothetical protein WBE72_16690 [Terracidiphilus sp.]
MNPHDHDRTAEHERMKALLKQSLPRVSPDEAPSRDLWPAVLRRLDAAPAAPPWFDWALLGGLVALAAFFPVSIPVFLYYL